MNMKEYHEAMMAGRRPRGTPTPDTEPPEEPTPVEAPRVMAVVRPIRPVAPAPRPELLPVPEAPAEKPAPTKPPMRIGAIVFLVGLLLAVWMLFFRDSGKKL